MACKHCGKDIDEHSFLSFTCPAYDDNGVRIGHDYESGNEYEEEEEKEPHDPS